MAGVRPESRGSADHPASDVRLRFDQQARDTQAMSIEVVLSKASAAKPRQRTATACRAVICAFAATGILSTNIFLPSLPAIAADLRVSSAAVTSTITVFLAIFAVGQLIVGPLSDRLGRQMPILIGLCIFMLGTMWCAFAGDLLGLVDRPIDTSCRRMYDCRSLTRHRPGSVRRPGPRERQWRRSRSQPRLPRGSRRSSAARLIIFSAGAPNLPLSRFSQSAPGRRMWHSSAKPRQRPTVPCIR